MFSTTHLIWILICIAIVTSLTIVSVKCKFSFKTSTIIICAIIGVSEITKIMYSMKPAASSGMVIRAGALPFHLCSIMIFVFAYLMFGKNEKTKEIVKSFTVPICLLGGVLAIIIPTSGVGFAQVSAYQCFIYHASMIWYGLYLYITGQAKLGLKEYARNLIILFVLAVIVIWINGALQQYDTNFFFLVRPPMEGLPIINLNNGWYVYFITLITLAFVLIGLVHLPYIIKQIIAKQKSKQNVDNAANDIEKTPIN